MSLTQQRFSLLCPISWSSGWTQTALVIPAISQPSRIKCCAADRSVCRIGGTAGGDVLLGLLLELCSFTHLCVPDEWGFCQGSGLTSEFPEAIERLLFESQLINSSREKKTVILRVIWAIRGVKFPVDGTVSVGAGPSHLCH